MNATEFCSEPAPKRDPILQLQPETRRLLYQLLEEAKDATRAELSPGTYVVEDYIGLAVRGKVKVAADYNSHIVATVKPWAVIAVLCEELREAQRAEPNLDRIIQRALKVTPELAAKAEEDAAVIVKALKKDTLRPCRGPVTCSGSVEVI